MVLRIVFLAVAFAFSVASGDELAWDNANIQPSNAGKIDARVDGPAAAIIEFRTSEPWPYVLLKPKNGKTWDISRYESISFEIENLDPKAQCEITFGAVSQGVKGAYLGPFCSLCTSGLIAA